MPWSSIKSDARVYYPPRMGTASSGCLLLVLYSVCRYGHNRMREPLPQRLPPLEREDRKEELDPSLVAGLGLSRRPSCSRCLRDPVLLSTGSGPRDHGTPGSDAATSVAPSLDNHGLETPLPERLQVLQPVPQSGLTRNLVSQPGPEKERSQVQDRMHDVQVRSFLICPSWVWDKS
jgi:hypothetical protein